MKMRLATFALAAAVGVQARAQQPADAAAASAQLAARQSETRTLLMAHATPIAPVDGPYRAADYEPVLPMLHGKRLIVVSEPTHGMHECRAENAKVVRFLVEQAGVRTLVTEMGYAEGLELNAFVHQGTGNLDDIIGVRGGVIWNTVEEADLMRWIAGWNRAHPSDTVRVAGMDIESNPSAGLALAKQIATLPLDATLINRITTGAEEASRSKGPAAAAASEAEKTASAAYDQALTDLLPALQALPAGPAREDALLAAMSVRGGRLSANLRAEGPNGGDAASRLREFNMARTALSVMAESTAPTVVVTHTVHLRPGRLAGDRVQSTGYHLARALGDRLFLIGEDYGTGSMRAIVSGSQPRRLHAAKVDPPAPGSISAALGDSGPLLVDLRDPRDGSAWSEWLESLQATHFYPAINYDAGDATKPNWTIPADSFDAMIYIPVVTPLHPIGAPQYVP